jgi:hypothetical protein
MNGLISSVSLADAFDAKAGIVLNSQFVKLVELGYSSRCWPWQCIWLDAKP